MARCTIRDALGDRGMKRLGWRGVAGLLAAMAVGAVARAQEGAGDVVYVPTPQVVVDSMLTMAKVNAKDYVIDLGSGDGRIVITAAKKFGASGFGVDLDAVLLKRANDNAKREGVADRAQFIEQNLFETDLSKATVITSYLLPEMNERLRPKILRLKPGTRVVAHDYHMGEWQPDDNDTLSVPEKTVGNPGTSYIYLWYVPANAAGKWQMRVPVAGQSLAVDVDFNQRFQMLSGNAKINERTAQIQGARVRGEDVTFWLTLGSGASAVRHEFNGKVQGDTLAGTLRVHAGKKVDQAAFSAKRTGPGKLDLGALEAPAAAL
ncbi:MAG: class I SAM-dependent methyltransferase [Burkholderiales bacterium]|nr:class I SAM-dependent methyltransferase [Burkholderiales bacterium]